MGRRPKSRNPDLDGVLVVDKPAGMTSHDVVAVVRGVTGQCKAGHTGTLDPDATGVLVVCLGRATRLVRFLQAGQKTYEARMVLGLATTTQDAAGEPTHEADASGVTEVALCEALTRQTGAIDQVPPMVSAIKVDGERLHEKARRGEVVEREPRRVTVHSIILDDFVPGPRAEAAFLVTCSAGTYVRTIAHDVGEDLGVGGSLTSLRRTANGQFTVDDAVSLDRVRELGEDGIGAVLLDLPRAVLGMPRFELDADEALAVTQGKPQPPRGVEGPYALLHDGQLLAVFADRDGRGRPEAVLAQPEDLASSDVAGGAA